MAFRVLTASSAHVDSPGPATGSDKVVFVNASSKWGDLVLPDNQSPGKRQ
jgi:hypothetical protein